MRPGAPTRPLSSVSLLLALVAAALIAGIVSQPVSAQAQASDPPAKPTGLSATALYNSVTLTWDDPDDDSITGYQVLRRDDALGVNQYSVHIDDTGTSTSEYIDRDVTPESDYYYRVRARNPAGLSTRSGRRKVEMPSPPSNLATTPLGAKDLGDITGQTGARCIDFSVNGNGDAVDYFSFMLTAPREVAFELTRQDRNADLYIENAGNHVQDSSESEGTDDENVEATLLEGTHYARVQTREGGSNRYRLCHEVSDPDQHTVDSLRDRQGKSEAGEDFSTDVTGNPIGAAHAGSPVTGDIAPAGDRDVFRIHTEHSRRYRIEVWGASTGHGTLVDPQMWVRWPGDDETWYPLDSTIGGTVDEGIGNNESYTIESGQRSDVWHLRVGGNGGAGTYTVVVTDISEAIFYNDPDQEVYENDALVISVRAFDVDDDDEVTSYAIVGGEDMDSFEIIGDVGLLSFREAPDHEQPGDEDEDNVYEVKVKVTSGDDGARSYQTLLITVLDLEEPDTPVSVRFGASRYEVTEGETVTITVLLSNDPDRTLYIPMRTTLRNSTTTVTDFGVPFDAPFQNGVSQYSFAFRPRSIQTDAYGPDFSLLVEFGALPDHVSLGTPATTMIFIEGVPTEDRPAAFTGGDEIDVSENTTSIVTVVAVDPDEGDTITSYSIVDGADRDLFTITSPGGVLEFSTAPDYESPADSGSDNVYEVVVEAASGSANLTSRQTINVTVKNDQDDERSGARNLGDITDQDDAAYTNHRVTSGDLIDYYRFRLTEPKKVILGLRRQDKNADLFLEDPEGVVIDSSRKGARADESLAETVLDGTYYIRVQAQEQGTNNYRLRYGVSSPTQSVVDRLRGGTDLTDSATGTPQGTVGPGSPAAGIIGPVGDLDVFRVDGENNRTYLLEVRGSPTGDGTLADPQMWVRWPGYGDVWSPLDVTTGGSPDSGTGRNERFMIETQLSADDWLIRVGGSGGTGTYTVVVTDISNAVFTSPDEVEVAENTAYVVTVVAEDVDDGDEVSAYGITRHYDHEDFTITSPGGVLSFRSPPDFEMPSDMGGDNIYEVDVKVTSGADRLPSYQLIRVIVTDVPEYDFEAIMDQSAESVSEGSIDLTDSATGTPQGTVIPGFSATGTIEPAGDLDVFRVIGEHNRAYRFEVRGSPTGDGTLTDPQMWFVWPGDVDVWSDPGPFTGGRPNAGTGKNERFEIDGAFDGEDWLIRVGGNGGTGTYTVVVTDISNAVFTNEAEVEIPEYTTSVITVVAEDVDEGDETSAYSLLYEGDSGLFSITSPGGVLSFRSPPDFERPRDGDLDNVYEVVVEATSGPDRLTSYQRIRVTVTDVDDDDDCYADNETTCTVSSATEATGEIERDGDRDWFSIELALDVQYRIDVRAGTLSDPALRIYDVAGRPLPGASDDNSGEGNDARLSYIPSTRGTYFIEVKGPDDVGTGSYTVAVVEDHLPIFTSDPVVAVPENTTAVTTVVARDPDASIAGYAITGGEDRSHFSITSPGGVLTFKIAPNYEIPFDANDDNVYEVIVEATTSENSTVSQTLRVEILNVDDLNDVPSGAVDLGNITNKTNSVFHSNRLDGVTDSVDYFKFRLTAEKKVSLGLRQLDAGASLFLEDDNGNVLASDERGGGRNRDLSHSLYPGTYFVRVEALEEGSNSYRLRYRLSTANLGRPPAFTSRSEFEVVENTVVVATAVASDPDEEDEITDYSIVGGEDARDFVITSPGGVLLFVSAPNYESPADAGSDNVYELTLQSTSGTDGLTGQQTITVTVTDEPDQHDTRESSIDLGGLTDQTTANSRSDSVDGDDDLVDYFRFTLRSPKKITVVLRDMEANADLYLEYGNGDPLAASENSDTAPEAVSETVPTGTHYIRVVSKEVGDNRYRLQYHVSAPDLSTINHAPSITGSSQLYAHEGFTSVGDLEAEDPDDLDQVTGYSITGGPDMERFVIATSTGVLAFRTAPDFEDPEDADTDGMYELIVTVTSGTGGRVRTGAQAITVTVLDESVHNMLSADGEADHSCAVASDRSIKCWGENYHGQAEGRSGEFRSVAVSDAIACGVDLNGRLDCWGNRYIVDDVETGARNSSPPAQAAAGGAASMCVIKQDGSLACWGADTLGIKNPQAGSYQSVSLSCHQMCAISTDGSVTCWGLYLSRYPVDDITPGTRYKSVSTGYDHACGVTVDNRMRCWGRNFGGQADPPSGETFMSVSAGYRHTCGVKTDGTVACWGNDAWDRATPPEGTFLTVAAGNEHTCGVRTDGTVACWGRNNHGQATPREGLTVHVPD